MTTIVGRKTWDFAAVRIWWPVAVVPSAAVLIAVEWRPWVLMWLLAVSAFLGFKLLTWLEFAGRTPVTCRHALVYVAAWPGLDADAFLVRRHAVVRPSGGQWCVAAGKTVLGAILFWGVARWAAPISEILAGWVGLTGLVFVLHFGAFHLLALAWRRAGVDVRPLMDAPVLARSVREFWGRRWNAAFRDLADRFVFRPLARQWGVTIATLAVFAFSGVVHDLIISLPAGAGYGLPTAYFLLQGMALLFEKSAAGRRMGLGAGGRGRAFAWIVVAGGAYWLFHPPFVREVVLPMMHAFGAL